MSKNEIREEMVKAHKVFEEIWQPAWNEYNNHKTTEAWRIYQAIRIPAWSACQDRLIETGYNYQVTKKEKVA